tara:strand:- start:1430 stop:1786 length:357 start_codon:yes stop_codon:yes gene_type:complete
MANPNIATASTILGVTQGATLTTSYADVVTAVPSNTVYKLNSISVANKTASDATVDVRIYTSGSDVFLLADGINVPAATTLVVLTKDQGLYINEAGKVNALASANSTLDILCSYESIA